MNVSMFSLRPKGRLRRSSASLQDMEVLGGEEPAEVKKRKSERVRTRGGVFRTHSGESFSENTGETMIDPSCCGCDDEKPKRRGKKIVKSRIGKLFRIKKSGKSKSRPKEEKSCDEHNTSSFETTSRVDSHDFSHEVSQAEIAEWVREQRSIKAKKESFSSMSSHKVKNKTISKKKKQREESMAGEEEIEKPLSVLVLDESIKLSSDSLLTTPDFDLTVKDADESTKPSSVSLLTAPDFDLTTAEEISDDIKDQSQPSIAKPCKPESRAPRSAKSKENKAPSSATKPPKPQSQTTRSDKSKEKKSESLDAKTSTPHPTKLQSSRSMGSQTTQSNRTPSSRRQRNFRREKNELDVTDHTSTSVKDDDSPSKTNAKRQEVSSSAISHSPPATIVAAEESINPRRRYPSKKHLRKKTRNNKSAVKTKGGSNRIDFTGEVSSPDKPLPKDADSSIVSGIDRLGNNSAVKAKGGSKRIDFTGEVSKPLPKDADSSIVSEINRLGSVVDIMMTRMAMYEKQTKCLVKASLAENEVRNKKVLQECDSNHSVSTVSTSSKQESTAGTPLPPQDWIRKLEGMQKGHRRRLTTTKRRLKALQTEQSMMNRKIVMSYEERLKLKDFSAHRNHEGGKVEGSTRSRSYRSMSSRTRSHRARAEHSRSNRSLLSNNRSIGEASSICDSAKVDMSLDMEDSCHTASTTRSERSVSFNPTVNVTTTLSRYDMCPRERWSYWAGDGDDDMTEEMLTYLTERWKVRNLVHEVEEELSSPSTDKREAPPFHSISDSIKQLLPPTEREGNDGYTYTVGIQN